MAYAWNMRDENAPTPPCTPEDDLSFYYIYPDIMSVGHHVSPQFQSQPQLQLQLQQHSSASFSSSQAKVARQHGLAITLQARPYIQDAPSATSDTLNATRTPTLPTIPSSFTPQQHQLPHAPVSIEDYYCAMSNKPKTKLKVALSSLPDLDNHRKRMRQHTLTKSTHGELYSPTESSLCCTLYPYDSEQIDPKMHYTKTGAQFDDDFEGSPTRSTAKQPVLTASLFNQRYGAQIDYLDVINDMDAFGASASNESNQVPSVPSIKTTTLEPESPSASADVPPLHAHYHTYRNGNSPQPSSIMLTPEQSQRSATGVSITFPETFNFERKPPPRKQAFNQSKNPFAKRKSNAFRKRNSLLQGTEW